MTVPSENRSPTHRSTARLAFRWARFVVAALTLVGLGVVAVDGLQPELRLRTVETSAAIQVRVVPKLAPKVDALQRRILGTEFFTAAWKELGLDQAADGGTKPTDEERETEFARWRRRLRVEVEPASISDRRSIRVVWSGLDDLELGEALVEALARRYADEISADRWYGSVDRLRAKVKTVETTSRELVALARRPAPAENTVSAIEPEPPSPKPAPVAASRIETLADVAGSDRAAIGPEEQRYRELIDRRARLAATMQADHPELQATEMALAAAHRSRPAAPTVVLTAAVEPEEDGPSIAPQLIAPNAPSPITRMAAKKPAPAFALPTKPAPLSNNLLEESARRLEAAGRELQTQMDDMLLPQEAEFPVVSVDRIGLQVGHLRPIWYAGVVLTGLLVAAAISIAWPRSSPAPSEASTEPLLPRGEGARRADEGQPSQPTRSAIEPAAPTKTEASQQAESPSDPYFRSAAEVEAKLAAPVLAVVSRRRAQAAAEPERAVRRAA